MDTSEHSEGTIRTRLTELFRIKHPILCAPMALVTGGELAAAVSAQVGWESWAGAMPATRE